MFLHACVLQLGQCVLGTANLTAQLFVFWLSSAPDLPACADMEKKDPYQ